MIKKIMKLILLAVFLLFLVNNVNAVPAEPSTIILDQPDGSIIEAQQIGDENQVWIVDDEGNPLVQGPGGEWELSTKFFAPGDEGNCESELDCKENSPPEGPSYAAQTGNKNIVVLLINFTNKTQGGTYTQAYYENLLFNTTSGSGSMWEYYNETSKGQINLSGSVYGWYQSNETMEYYGADGGSCGGSIDSANGCIFALAAEALNLSDGDVNYSIYDTDSDGIINNTELNVIIIHAGNGQESSASSNDIWSHRWTIYGSYLGYNDIVLDGVRLNRNVSNEAVGAYAMQAESSPMGTFAHEYGHMLGLPDLYRVTPSGDGLGDWGIMATGSWNGAPAGSSPAYFSAWSRYYLGWINPIILTETNNTINVTFPQIETTDTVYMLLNSTYTAGNIPDTGTTEYFLVENRQKTGFDSYLPGDGLLIWHIDETVGDISSNNIQNTASRKRVDLEEADGTDTEGNEGQAGDPWENDTIGFNRTSTPNSDYYNDSDSKIVVTSITASGANINATIGFVNLAPTISNVTINPTNPTILNNITCNYTYSGDFAENTTLTEYKWFENNTLQTNFTNQTTILAVNTSLGDIWHCEVTPYDVTPTAGTPVNSSNVTLTEAYEFTAPSVNYTIPVPIGVNSFNLTVNNTLSISATDVVVSLYVNDTYDSNTTINLSSSSESYVIFQPNFTAYGAVNLTFVVDPLDAFDEVNDTNNNLTQEVTVDYTAPTIVINAPATGLNISGTGTINATLSDVDSNINGTYTSYVLGNSSNNYTEDGNAVVGNTWSTFATTDNLTFTDTFTSGNFADGNYTLFIRSSDDQDKTSLNSTTITIDNTDPVANVDIDDTSITSAQETTIDCTATDATSGVYTIRITAESNSDTNPKTCTGTTSCSASYDPSSTGTKDITCLVTDYAGNTDTDTGIITVSSASSNSDLGSGGGAGGDSGTTGGFTSKIINVIEPSEPSDWTVPSTSNSAITNMVLAVKETMGDVTMKVKKLDAKPSATKTTPAGEIYQYLELGSSGISSTQIASITIKFKIPKTWVTGNSVDKDSVELKRYVGNGWTKLTTQLKSEDTTNYYYSAVSPGFSYFAIAGKEIETSVISAEGLLDPKQIVRDEDGNILPKETLSGTATIDNQHGLTVPSFNLGPLTTYFAKLKAINYYGMTGDLWLVVSIFTLLFFVVITGVYKQEHKKLRVKKHKRRSKTRRKINKKIESIKSKTPVRIAKYKKGKLKPVEFKLF